MNKPIDFAQGKAPPPRTGVTGLRANWQQFALLVLINGFVGAMLGAERTVIPLIAQDDFHIVSGLAVLSFVAVFGIAKSLSNLAAGSLADRVGRKRVLVAGWLIGLPVPLLIALAPDWGWVVGANLLLGINQGLCWSSTVIMKIDLVNSRQRGFAMGINEFAGYLAVSLSGLAAGYLVSVYGLRPYPLYPSVAFALLGLLLSVVYVRETHPFPGGDMRTTKGRSQSLGHILVLTSGRDRGLFAISQAGMVNNFNDGIVWGLVPIFLTSKGLPLDQVAIIVSLYPGIWALSQLVTGPLSDRWGRKWMISAGMWVQAGALGLLALGQSFWHWTAGAALLGLGTALVYPTLLAAVSDWSRPEWRATSVGAYRLWRDGGYVLGALIAGLVADVLGFVPAIGLTAGLTFLSGIIVARLLPGMLAPAGTDRR
ncbi:MAG: MFS transporter [Chloroflexi bacterium]|nr:MFS transporter [Chloroflexota bacterium]